jgi:hypothetical protein
MMWLINRVDQNNVMLCHAVKTKQPAKSIHTSIGLAFKSASESMQKSMAASSTLSPTAKKYAHRQSMVGPDGKDMSEHDRPKLPDFEPTDGKKPAGPPPDSGKAIGTFVGVYLGSVVTTEKSGQAVCDEAMNILAEQRVENGAQMSSKIKLTDVVRCLRFLQQHCCFALYRCRIARAVRLAVKPSHPLDSNPCLVDFPLG